MKAMIFAAGLGTRLYPLTESKPKALVEVNNKPLILHNLEYLAKYGVTEFVVNVHHFGQQVIDYCKQLNDRFNIHISDERDELLDTGGGLKNAFKLLSELNEPIIVMNADVLCNANLQHMLEYHQVSSNLVTLAVRDRYSSRKLLFNEDSRLAAWKNVTTGDLKTALPINKQSSEYAFSGLQIISSKVFELFPSDNKFSIINFYLSIAVDYRIGNYIHNDSYWFDVGTIEKLTRAEDYINNNNT